MKYLISVYKQWLLNDNTMLLREGWNDIHVRYKLATEKKIWANEYKQVNYDKFMFTLLHNVLSML